MLQRAGFVLLALASFAFGQEFKVGGKIQDFTITDLKGTAHRYNELKTDTTVVAFIATKCPVSNSYNERMEKLYQDYAAKGVHFIFINANSTEPASEVAQHAAAHKFTFPVYKDPNNVVADRFGATVTPEMFIMDKTGTIRYHGSIDDSMEASRIKAIYFRDALNAVLNGQNVPKTETKAFGCTIKRVSKTTT